MKELSDEELIDFIKFKIQDGSLAYCFDKDNPPSCSRCKFNPCEEYQEQILTRLKLKVSEEWIDDKALILLTISFHPEEARHREKIEEYKDFIRKLVEQIPQKKVIFMMEHIREFLDDLMNIETADDEAEFMREWLEGHEGVEVGEK